VGSSIALEHLHLKAWGLMSDHFGKSTLTAFKARRDKQKVNARDIGEAFARDLAQLMPKAFDKVDDNLFDLANNAHNNNEQNRYFEAMREIRLKKRRIEQVFVESLTNEFNISSVRASSEQIQDKINSDALSLVDTHVLEEDIAVTDMANKAAAEVKPVMLTLQRRAAEMYGLPDTQFNNPFAPKTIAKSIAHACEPLDIELPEKLLLLKQFDKCVMPELGNLLSKYDEKLLRAGILSELTSRDARRSGTTTTKVTKQEADKRDTNTPSNALPLQTLMAANRDHTHLEHTHSNPHASLNTREVLQLIDRISPRWINISNAGTPSSENILAKIHDELEAQSANSRKPVKRDDLKVINLVSMLFQYILDDENLAPEMQALIAKLQLPILKVVLLDPSFFDSKNHPARQYLDRLARAGIGWNNNGTNHGDALFEVLKLSVERAVNDFENNVELFANLNHELDRYLNREKKRQELLEQRTQRSEEGRIRSRAAQNIVNETLEYIIRSSKKPLPKAIDTLLRDAWSRVMFMAFLKDKEQHGWDQCKRMAEELVWCVDHNSSESDRQRWVTTVPRLLKEIDREISKLSVSGSSRELVESVRETLAALFRETSIHDSTNTKKQASRAETKDGNSAISDQRKKAASDSKLLHEKISHIEPGQWVEFIGKDNRKLRYKLSARIEEADCFIFVDRIGLNPIEKSSRDLAQDIEKRRLRLLDKGPLIDRAISQMIGSLHRN
jgi:hypothetical protein